MRSTSCCTRSCWRSSARWTPSTKPTSSEPSGTARRRTPAPCCTPPIPSETPGRPRAGRSLAREEDALARSRSGNSRAQSDALTEPALRAPRRSGAACRRGRHDAGAGARGGDPAGTGPALDRLAAVASRLIAIVGPTAAGKSALALRVAAAHGGEIVSCDSLQVYRGLDVGSAKPSLAERRRVPHHLIDVVEPDEPFSAAEYARLARACLHGIAER